MFIDLNAPDNDVEEHKRYIKLWQNVIIAAARDAVKSSRDAHSVYIENKHWWSEEVCRMANLDYGMVSKWFYMIKSDEKYRKEMAAALYCYKSKNAGHAASREYALQQMELSL